MLILRIYTAIFLLGLFTPIFIWAPFALIQLSVAFISSIAAWEWVGLLKLNLYLKKIYVIIVFMMIVGLKKISSQLCNELLYFSMYFWLLFVPYALWNPLSLQRKGLRIFLLLSGIPILGLFGIAVCKIYQLGHYFFLYILTIVWLADMGAFFSGRCIGGVKFAPRISPNKTWSGVVGGYSLVIFVTLIVFTFVRPAILIQEVEKITHLDLSHYLDVLKFLILISSIFFFCVIGDLFESLLKRQANVKDSGSLLPGHGGILDRIDSSLPIFPMIMFLLVSFRCS